MAQASENSDKHHKDIKTDETDKPSAPDHHSNEPNSSSSKVLATKTIDKLTPSDPKQAHSAQVRPNDNKHISKTAASLVTQYQPSKAFLAKCRTELDDLLKAIQVDYHEELKQIYAEEKFTNLLVAVGEEDLDKKYHQCIVASRAYKFFTALKTFAIDESQLERDIIVSEIQQKLNETLEDKGSDDQIEESIELKEPPTISIRLPSEIISRERLVNFFRCLYLNADLVDEESKLHKSVSDWIKSNKPELVKSPTPKNSPNHRESFRTILPDYEESGYDKNSTMSSGNQSKLTTTSNLSELGDSQLIDFDDSPATTQTNDSLTNSIVLTRTETFELISKTNPDSPSIEPTQAKSVSSNSQFDDDREELQTDETSETSDLAASTAAAYAPTTRTGLRPKTFTVPPGTKPITSSTPKTRPSAAKTPTARDLAKQPTTRPSGATRGAAQTNRTVDSKRTSSDTSGSPPVAAARTRPAASTAAKPPTKASPLTRAQPISLERSQSPNTNAVRRSGRNFIEANKRLAAMQEKKRPITPQQADTSGQPQQPEPVIQPDIAELSVLEPLTMDNLTAQLDKFTLINHSKLADALARLFVDQVLPDTTILVSHGKQIQAHKCILAARSPYLADYISKQCSPSSESADRQQNHSLLKIDLSDFSYGAVYFAMMHIYTGVVKVPADLDVEALTGVTHKLHITTLRQVCIHHLRMNYCHFFHKPCEVCCLGVLKALPRAWRYDFTELYSKCLQWIGTHFASIFCLKEFSELKPNDLLEECYTATLSQLTPDNIIPKTIECQKLLKSLPRVKWTESIICLVGRQLEDFCHYVADNYEKILKSDSFINLSKNCWECEVLEENLLAAMNHLKPDSGCRTLIALDKIECSMELRFENPTSDSFANLVTKMRKYCERYLLKDAAAVVHCSSWRQMSPSLQKRIKDQAIISSDFDEPTKQLASKPKLLSVNRGANQARASPDTARSPSNRSTPDMKPKSPNTTYLPLPKTKAPTARHVKVLK